MLENLKEDLKKGLESAKELGSEHLELDKEYLENARKTLKRGLECTEELAKQHFELNKKGFEGAGEFAKQHLELDKEYLENAKEALKKGLENVEEFGKQHFELNEKVFKKTEESGSKGLESAVELAKKGFDNAAGFVKKGLDDTKELAKETWEHMDDFGKWIQENPIKTLKHAWEMFALWIKGLNGSSLMTLLFGLGGSIAGFSLAFGLALLPGLGFIIGLFVGTQITEQQKQDVAEQFKKSPEWIKTNVEKLVQGIQSVWDQVIAALHIDLTKWADGREEVEKAGFEITQIIQKSETENHSSSDTSKKENTKN